MNTKQINNQTITLESGKSYIASRPFASHKNQLFPITIKDMETNQVCAKLNPMSYEKANEFLNAFNNGENSFDGRYWD